MPLVPIVHLTATPGLPSASATWTTVALPLPSRLVCLPRAPELCATFQRRGRDNKPLTGTVALCAWCGSREDSRFEPRAVMHIASRGLLVWPSTIHALWIYAHPSFAQRTRAITSSICLDATGCLHHSTVPRSTLCGGVARETVGRPNKHRR